MTNTDRPRLIINPRVLERVLEDCLNHPHIEIGGRWFGFYLSAEDRAAAQHPLDSAFIGPGDLHIVLDYIPNGPNPESQTAVELQPDRRYQLWTFESLREIDDNIEVLGSWHSHIPNGLERFSSGDHESYHSKLNNPEMSYPLPRMLCSLIHSPASDAEEVRRNLHHSWFEKGAPLGEYQWLQAEDVYSIDVEVPGSDLIELDDFSSYLESLVDEEEDPLSVDDWLRAAERVAVLHGGSTHQLNRSPDGQRWKLVESNGVDSVALMADGSGVSRLVVETGGEKRSERQFHTIDEAARDFQEALRILGMDHVAWSHLTPSLARTLRDETRVREELKRERALGAEKQHLHVKELMKAQEKAQRTGFSWMGRLSGKSRENRRMREENEKLKSVLKLLREGSDLPPNLSVDTLSILVQNDLTTIQSCRSAGSSSLSDLGIKDDEITQILPKQLE